MKGGAGTVAASCRFCASFCLSLIILLWVGLAQNQQIAFYAVDHYTRILQQDPRNPV